ncbi:multicopper oxidase family protein [Actinoplanes sp. NPDC000266]
MRGPALVAVATALALATPGHGGGPVATAVSSAPPDHGGDPVATAVFLAPPDHGGDPVAAVGLAALSPDSEIALTLTARAEGERYTLNGATPGPEIHVERGRPLRVTLVNESVPEAVGLHWHGVRMPNADEGVAVGMGERHVYRLRLPDEGTYWYHGHSATRRGLFGALVVGASEADVDEVLAVHTYDGKRTINGLPGVSSLTGIAGPSPAPGAVARVRVINTDVGPIRVWVSGAPYRVVAVDGHAVYRPSDISGKSISVASGGRVDLSFAGAARVDVGGGAAAVWGSVPAAPQPASVQDLLSYGTPVAPEFDPARAARHFDYRIGRRIGFLDGRPGLWWSVNGKLRPRAPAYRARRGDVVRMTISNTTGEAHPMHLHGHHALVLGRDGVAASGSPWWIDSLTVGGGETYEIAFVASEPGDWTVHCHDPEHEAGGLRASIGVR